MIELMDAHSHLTELTVENLYNMSLCGITTMVSPGHLNTKRAISPEAVIDLWNTQIEYMLPRAQAQQIKAYAMVGISMVSTPRGGEEEIYKLLPEYLAKPEVVAVGEVGFEPGSGSNNDHDYQKEIFARQIEIVRDCNSVIDVHTPNAEDNKIKYTKESLELIKELGLPMDRVVIDHCTNANIEMVLDAGAYAAISVQPWRIATPQLAAEWILEYKSDRIFVDSDCSPLASDPLAVAKVAFELRKKGASDDFISDACCRNAKRAFRID